MTAPALSTPPVCAAQWLGSREMTATLRRQITEELTVIRGERGPQFCQFAGISDREAAIARLEVQLASLG